MRSRVGSLRQHAWKSLTGEGARSGRTPVRRSPLTAATAGCVSGGLLCDLAYRTPIALGVHEETAGRAAMWRSARWLGSEEMARTRISCAHLSEWPSMQAPAAVAFYDSRAPLTERRAKLDRRLAGIASEFAVQWELNRVDSALTQVPSGSKTYWGLSDRVAAPEDAQRRAWR